MRYGGMGETLDAAVPFKSVDEILRAKWADGLFNYLLESFAVHSGMAGVQPKVLIRATHKQKT